MKRHLGRMVSSASSRRTPHNDEGTIRVEPDGAHAAQTLGNVEFEVAAMNHFPQTWLPIIGKHLRRHLGLSADTPLAMQEL